MASFRYQSLTSAGQVRQGVIAAIDRPTAVRTLLGRGETATSIDPVQERDAHPDSTGSVAVLEGSPPGRPAGGAVHPNLARALQRRLTRPSAHRAEMATLIRELATVIEAGLPIMQGLHTVRRQCPNRTIASVLDHLILRVESGAPLYQAAAEYGPPFDDLIIGMLRAADASGEMSEILHQLADLLDRSLELRRELLGATLYPMILGGLVVTSVIILVTVLVPRLIEPLAGEFNLPMPTRILLGIAGFVSSYWIHCAIGMVLLWVGWQAWVRLPANRLRVDTLKLRIPVLGRLLRDVAVARFTRTLGTLISAGIPILDALRVTRDTLGNAALKRQIDTVREHVTAGKSLADPLERSGLFPPLLVQVVNLGERSGRLESMLLHAAGAFDRQVSSSIKLFTKAFPPLLIMIMACLGGFVLAAILLPLLELQSMIG